MKNTEKTNREKIPIILENYGGYGPQRINVLYIKK